MDELVAFVTARLDEVETAARRATPGPWRQEPQEHQRIVGPTGVVVCVAGAGEMSDRQGQRDAGHIARNDPARVLREIEAKREVVRQCADLHAGDSPLVAYSAGVMLRALAAVYVGHPDYPEAWRP